MNWPAFSNLLAPWQWALLLAIPPAIIALYFLKLRRRPLEVPSTYLWKKAIEDLHVNSLWQRLRRNLLLFLQLLLVLLAILALLDPHWQGEQQMGQRNIFLIDQSASMSATDIAPTRLDEAKRQAAEMIRAMPPGASAMIISFADSARVVQPFTSNHDQLLEQLATIGPTNRSTSMTEALRVAAGLASTAVTSSTESATEGGPTGAMADLYILSDGHFPRVEGVSLGNLNPIFTPLGETTTDNVGIVAFSAERNSQLEQIQAFARVENFSAEQRTVIVELLLDGELIDADQVVIPAGEAQGVQFDLANFESGVLELRAETGDQFPVDDRAWAVVNPPQPVNVLLVTPGNEPLEYALRTEGASQRAKLLVERPNYLETDSYRQGSAAGLWSVIIYDRCAPESMPAANTVFIGRIPPQGGWGLADEGAVPIIIDVNQAHPIMSLIDLSDVLIVEASALQVPRGGSPLVEAQIGTLMAIAPRDRFEDLVVAFELVSDGGVGTNWPLRLSFPVWVLNTVAYLGGGSDLLATGSVRPGQAVVPPVDPAEGTVTVRTPAGRQVALAGSPGQAPLLTETEQLGPYALLAGDQPLGQFAVNLFDRSESNLAQLVDPAIQLDYVEIEGRMAQEAVSRRGWRALLLAALVILVAEWYVYNRRVYI